MPSAVLRFMGFPGPALVAVSAAMCPEPSRGARHDVEHAAAAVGQARAARAAGVALEADQLAVDQRLQVDRVELPMVVRAVDDHQRGEFMCTEHGCLLGGALPELAPKRRKRRKRQEGGLAGRKARRRMLLRGAARCRRQGLLSLRRFGKATPNTLAYMGGDFVTCVSAPYTAGRVRRATARRLPGPIQ